MKSVWNVFTNANREAGAEKILNRILANLEIESHEIGINSYHKGGFKISFTINHVAKEWNDIVVECIALGQRIGNEWKLFGDILKDPSAIINNSNVSGVEMIEWQLNR